MEDKFYTPQDIAKTLKVAYMTVYRWIRAGKLKAYKIGKQYRITEKDFNSFIKNNLYKTKRNRYL